VLRVRERRETVRRNSRGRRRRPDHRSRVNPRFDRTERRRQDDLVHLVSGLYTPDTGIVQLNGRESQGLPSHLICHRGSPRSFQITNLFGGLSIYENLRLSLQARHAMRFNNLARHRQLSASSRRNRRTDKFLGLEGIEEIEGGELSYGGQRRGTWGSRSAPNHRCCCSMSRWLASPPPSANACRT